MDRITVNVDELYKVVSKIKRDAMTYVTIFIDEPLEPIGDDDEAIPAQLSLSAVRKLTPEIAYDYEEIDAIPEDVYNAGMSFKHTDMNP